MIDATYEASPTHIERAAREAIRSAASAMTTREQRFLDELPQIERVIRSVCSRRYLRGADGEDFRSVVMTRMIENDYAVLFEFEGRSTIRTFLTIVINRLYSDFQTKRFGRWRNSAGARRLGPTAERLECLLFRDGLTFSEACGVLTADPGVSETAEALEELRSRLPHRVRGRDLAAKAELPAVRPASWEVDSGERQTLADRIFEVIDRSLCGLPTEDRLFLRLHFANGLTPAQIARARRMDQKALYRRRDKILETLRLDLEREGIEAGDALELLSNLDWDAACLSEEPEEQPLPLSPPSPPPPAAGAKQSEEEL